MHRFLAQWPLTEEFSLSEGLQFHQIIHVFRAKKGDKVIFFEVGGNDIIYEVRDISKRGILFSKRSEMTNRSKNKSKKITVFQAYPNKIGTMETIVQKLAELGIDEVVFFVSKYSQIDEIPTQKQRRIQTIAEEALEQSGGNIPISIIYASEDMGSLFMKYKNTHHVIWFPGPVNHLPSLSWDPIWLWIWPEGWWSPEERELFKEKNLFLWSFSGNILRLETANMVGAWLLSYIASNIAQ